ncbi:unnamed protein product [Thelazia callipaeda]|uniref:Secreted protein n=1 Tax=Thelazia callipaeda TaxID=103827 RepID=A0A0N5D7C9_THECL|nr:unnamed protein product [Thelazia callipaeda]
MRSTAKYSTVFCVLEVCSSHTWLAGYSFYVIENWLHLSLSSSDACTNDRFNRPGKNFQHEEAFNLVYRVGICSFITSAVLGLSKWQLICANALVISTLKKYYLQFTNDLLNKKRLLLDCSECKRSCA